MLLAGIIANQILVMFMLMLIGFVLKRKQFLHDNGLKDMTNLLLIAVMPIVIVNAFCVPYENNKAFKLLICLLLSVFIHLLFIVMGRLLFKNNGMFQNAVILSNAGFMGIPLVMAIQGVEAVFYLSAYMAVNSIVQWTYGLSKLNNQFKFSLSSIIFTPVMLAFAAGLCIFFFDIHTPKPLLTLMSHITSMNTPLAMILLGAYLDQLQVKELKKHIIILWKPVLCRLILFPLTVFFLLSLLPNNLYDIRIIYLILAASPTALSVALFAARNNQQTAQAIEIVCLSTLLCLITIPFLILLAR